MDESEAYVRWHTDAVAAQNPCADEVSSLVQSVRDHARTTRRLAKAEAMLKDEKAKTGRVYRLHHSDGGRPEWCVACEIKYPCQTIRALNDSEGGA